MIDALLDQARRAASLCDGELSRLLTELADALERVTAAVRSHHDQRGDDRCHLDDMKLYHDALGIEPDPYVTALPPDADMEESCRRYVRQRQCPAVAGSYLMPGGMTIAQLTAELERVTADRDRLAALEWGRVERAAAASEARARREGGGP